MTAVESRGVSKLLVKVEDSLKLGKFYEAHQIYRTIYFRLAKQEKFPELSDLLYDGAVKLIAAKQFQSGCDLSLLLIEVLQKCKFDDKEFENRITQVGGLIESIEADVVEREFLIVRAVKWSSEGNKKNGNQGHPLIHRLIARTMAKEQNFEGAVKHYLLSKDGVGFARILIQLSNKAFNSEIDLIIVQAVLNLLVLKEVDTALSTFNSYCLLHPKIKTSSVPYRAPLLNFLYFLLKIIDEKVLDKLNAFRTLCVLYKTALSRDPAFDKQLQVIGESFFGAPPARPSRQTNGMFSDLFSTLFQELEDDTDDDETLPTTSAQFRANVDLD